MKDDEYHHRGALPNSFLTTLPDAKSADKAIVEYLVKDYNKPMGVATFRTKEEMPEKLRKSLPDIDELKKLL